MSDDTKDLPIYGPGGKPIGPDIPPLRGYDKPTADQLLTWIADAIARGQRANIGDPVALASMVMGALRAQSVKMIVHHFDNS